MVTSASRGCASSSSRSRRSARTSLVLHLLVALRGLGKLLAQAIAIVLVTPLNFVGNKLWSFRRRVSLSSLRAGEGSSSSLPSPPSPSPSLAPSALRRGHDLDAYGPRLRRQGPPRPDAARPAAGRSPLTRRRGARGLRALSQGRGLAVAATRKSGAATRRRTTRRPASGRSRSGGEPPGRSPRARSSTRPASVTEAWTGPQVAWGMARGSPGAFGGTAINNPWVWGAFCLVFLVGLGDLRRPFSLRNLDLLFLLSPTASLWYFNHGDVFTAVPLFYPLPRLGGAARDVDRHAATAARRARRAGRSGCCSARRSSSPASGSGSTSSART